MMVVMPESNISFKLSLPQCNELLTSLFYKISSQTFTTRHDNYFKNGPTLCRYQLLLVLFKQAQLTGIGHFVKKCVNVIRSSFLDSCQKDETVFG